MEDTYFLREGKFTQRKDIVKKALDEAFLFTERETCLRKISLYIDRIQMNKPKNIFQFRRRTASDVIQSGKSNGCSDYGIAFAVLSREAGIPTQYIETFEEQNLLTHPYLVLGHVFLEVLIDGNWQIYNPKEGFKKTYSLGDRTYIPVAKGLDFSELFLNNGQQINLDSLDKIRELRNLLSKDYN